MICPKCNEKIIVPNEDDDFSSPAGGSDENGPFQEFQVFDDDFDEPELVYDAQTEATGSPKLNDRLSVPRRMVYLQGILLGIVAIVFFLLGLLVGSGGRQSSAAVDRAIVTGTVVLDDRSADEGAVVFLLPSRSRPGAKFESEELRPGRTFTSANPEVPLIRRFGGNVSTTNRAGQFEMQVEPNREYILLVVSANGSRTDELDSDFHSTLGPYFTSLDNLTEGKACYYKRVLPLRTRENLGEIVVHSVP